jgi:hypothetical protein
MTVTAVRRRLLHVLSSWTVSTIISAYAAKGTIEDTQS